MGQLLALTRRPTAVLVSTFDGAVGALRAINEAGLRAPDDISIVSFDDPVTASFLTPSLTCVAMPFEEMGSTAVDVIAEVVEGGPGRSVVVDTAPRLVVRESLRSIG
jgi:DNA-binding LacI/PurR family transcriptional regulator